MYRRGFSNQGHFAAKLNTGGVGTIPGMGCNRPRIKWLTAIPTVEQITMELVPFAGNFVQPGFIFTMMVHFVAELTDGR